MLYNFSDLVVISFENSTSHFTQVQNKTESFSQYLLIARTCDMTSAG